MSAVQQANRELARLDAARVRRQIDDSAYREARRRVLLDFEERQSQTTPGVSVAHSSGAGESAGSASPKPGMTKGAKLAIVVVVVALVAVVGWANRSRDEAPAASPSSVPAATADLPQDTAAQLVDSAWTDQDLAEFLRRWRQLSPESVHAAQNDSRIWLLRGETDKRLRNARDALSLDGAASAADSDTSERIRQLEAVQRAIGAP